MADAKAVVWSFGLKKKVGLALSFGAFGLGIEHSWTTKSYKPIDTEMFGHNKNKFNNGITSIYLHIRYGK